MVSNEKRKDLRFILALPMEIRSPEAVVKTRTKNISCSGIFCESNILIPKDTKVDVKLRFSYFHHGYLRTKDLLYPGQIARIEKITESGPRFLTAIAFDRIDRKKKEFLLSYIQQKNLKEAQELKQMYLRLKDMAARLVEVEECHPTAEHFRSVIDRAITELDAAAHILDFEINELKSLE